VERARRSDEQRRNGVGDDGVQRRALSGARIHAVVMRGPTRGRVFRVIDTKVARLDQRHRRRQGPKVSALSWLERVLLIGLGVLAFVSVIPLRALRSMPDPPSAAPRSSIALSTSVN
jgi:hypothetical protein